MNCRLAGCRGQYESRSIVHSSRRREQVIVIDQVPAEVCKVCGDTLLLPATLRRLQDIVQSNDPPNATAPLYNYTSSRSE